MRHDEGSEFCGGAKDTEVTHEVLFGGRYQGTDSAHEVVGRHEGVGGAVMSLFRELEYDLVVFVANELLVREWRSGDVTAQTLKALAVVGGDVQSGMDRKAVDIGGALIFRGQTAGRGYLFFVDGEPTKVWWLETGDGCCVEIAGPFS